MYSPYENDFSFFAHDAEMERADLAREARFELASSTPEEDARFYALDAQLTEALGETALDQVTRHIGDFREPINFGLEASTIHMLRARFGKRVA